MKYIVTTPRETPTGNEGIKNMSYGGRVAATSVIWGISGGMLAICIPLVMVSDLKIVINQKINYN